MHVDKPSVRGLADTTPTFPCSTEPGCACSRQSSNQEHVTHSHKRTHGAARIHTHTQPAMQGNLHLLQKANKIEYSRAGQERRDWNGGASLFMDDFWPDVEYGFTGEPDALRHALPSSPSLKESGSRTSFSFVMKAAGSFGSLTRC